MSYKINKEDLTNIKISAIQDILPNESIGIWVIDKPMSDKSRFLFQSQMQRKWWETDDLGRYCNHSPIPNTVVYVHRDRLELKAKTFIQSGMEIMVDYRTITECIGYIPDLEFLKI
ncbi:MAG: SET domain-containing protein-lysine N-methyltransferase [Flavobacterium sp.]|uniref:SET domain-containing protein-lysine N-methyltransferase n=1 Tax=Flavobacterium sp. TaxID=239 RepID=UPI001B19AAE8|nr:SET domain-containing protein [Flavobacterium sp.]MBO9586637.1 SET domain-containing protein-lysine N-methyltransferase [Flavobacterium sp.]